MKLLSVSTALFFAAGAFAHDSKISDELRAADPNTPLPVIVQFDKDPTDVEHHKLLGRGGSLRGTLHAIKGGAYTIAPGMLADLESDPSVVHISQDHAVQANLDYSAAAINAQFAWSFGFTGDGIGVAVIDSGIGPSADLNAFYHSTVVYSESLVGGDTLDHYGHGEHIAGIIASQGGGSLCMGCTHAFVGIAPNAKIVNLRVLDENGESTDSAVIAAIDRAIQLKSKFNIRVINLSLGRIVFESYKNDPLCQAVEAAWKAGIVVVVAAGNQGRLSVNGSSGYGTINSPGNDPYVITVGAMKTNGTYDRSDDTIASYSSKGPTMIDHIVKPDIVAPGNRVVSLLPSLKATLAQEYPQNLINTRYYKPWSVGHVSDEYYMLSGTSMAAAVVSGAVADLLQQQPWLTPDQVKVKLMLTADKTFPEQSVAVDPVTGATYTSYYDIFTVGAGYLDLQAALSDMSVPQGSAVSPVAQFADGVVSVTLPSSSALVGGSAAAWGSSVLNSVLQVTGTAAAWGSSASWGSSGIFSSSFNAADAAIWGSGGAWGSSSAWGSNSAWGSSGDESDKNQKGKPAKNATSTNPVLITGEQ